MTLVWSFKALAFGSWNASGPDFHAVLGLIVLSAILIVAFSGMNTIMIAKFYRGTPAWSKSPEPQTRVGKFHKLAGYSIILLGLAATTSGLYTYQKTFYEGNEDVRYAIANFFVFISILIFSELIYRIWKWRSSVEVSKKESKRSITLEEFSDLVINKKKRLIILDNKVLDFGEYDDFHPGGKFYLQKNIGRDISKFFYGSYKLINDSTQKAKNHSAAAMAIANGLTIGHLEGQGKVVPIKVRITKTIYVNNIANTV